MANPDLTTGRRYIRRARVAHLITPSDLDKPIQEALCGIRADAEDWYGAASQDEYTRATTLPLCLRCHDTGH